MHPTTPQFHLSSACQNFSLKTVKGHDRDPNLVIMICAQALQGSINPHSDVSAFLALDDRNHKNVLFPLQPQKDTIHSKHQQTSLQHKAYSISTSLRAQHRLPASYYRGGTSRAIFLPNPTPTPRQIPMATHLSRRNRQPRSQWPSARRHGRWNLQLVKDLRCRSLDAS